MLGVYQTAEEYVGDPTQIVFVDTPGMVKGHSALTKHMRKEALSSVHGVEVCLVVVDGSDKKQRHAKFWEQGEPQKLAQTFLSCPNVIVAVNKIDTIGAKSRLLPVLEEYSDAGVGSAWIPISAETGEGVDILVDQLLQKMPLAPFLFTDDRLTDKNEQFLCAEMVREQIFHLTQKEVPYSTAVVVERFREDDRRVVIDAVIVVEKPSQKAIIIGKGGSMIGQIRSAAETSLRSVLDKPVRLRLFVKTQLGWSQTPEGIRGLGYGG